MHHEYQFVLAAINSAPTLVAMINSTHASLRTDSQGLFYNPSGNFVNIEKSFIDQCYQTASQRSQSQGATNFLAAVGHEFGHAVFQTQTQFSAESEKRKQALISGLSNVDVGADNFSAQQFVDAMNTEMALTEGYAAIMAFNTLVSTDGTSTRFQQEFPELYHRLLDSAHIVPNSDGTITPTTANTLASAKEVVKSAFYRNTWAPYVLPYLRSHVRAGEVIKLSGYSNNNSDGQDFSSALAAAGFRPTGKADTFVAI